MPSCRSAAWQRLRSAIDRACIARGNAQWMNGYRAGRIAAGEEESDDLYRQEMDHWPECGKAEVRVEREMAAYLRAETRAAKVDSDAIWWLDPITLPSGDRIIEGHLFIRWYE